MSEIEHVSSRMTPHSAPNMHEAYRRLLIPGYNAFHRIPLSVVHLERIAPVVVDLGCGSGTMTERVLERWPKAHVVLIDYNPKMIDAARKHFESHGDFIYIVDDFTLVNLGWMRCDLVVSNLVLHHQVSEEKRALFARVFDTLRPGGYFVLCDIVSGPTSSSDTALVSAWHEYVRGVFPSPEEADAALHCLSLDNPSTVADQTKWLEKTGFTEVDCPYRMLRFASIVARKPVRKL